MHYLFTNVQLDFFFHLLHGLVISINLFGWTIPRLRKITLGVQTLTLGLWVGFGLWKNRWGYCPLTDWHWQVKRMMGETNLPPDYVSYVTQHGLGLDFSHDFIRGLILGTFALAFLANLYLIWTRPR